MRLGGIQGSLLYLRWESPIYSSKYGCVPLQGHCTALYQFGTAIIGIYKHSTAMHRHVQTYTQPCTGMYTAFIHLETTGNDLTLFWSWFFPWLSFSFPPSCPLFSFSISCSVLSFAWNYPSPFGCATPAGNFCPIAPDRWLSNLILSDLQNGLGVCVPVWESHDSSVVFRNLAY